jgi:hypothetical protein
MSMDFSTCLFDKHIVTFRNVSTIGLYILNFVVRDSASLGNHPGQAVSKGVSKGVSRVSMTRTLISI